MATARAATMRPGSGAGSGLLAAVRRRIGITPTGVVLLGLAVLGWVLARLLGSRAMFFLVYGVAVIIGISYLMGRRKLAIDAVRSELPTRVREGQLVSVELTLGAKRRLSTVIIEEALPERFGATVRIPIPSLPPGQEVKHVYNFTPRLRGVYNVGPLSVTWSDPFGLTEQRVVLTEPVEIIVHPSTEMVHDRVVSREWEDPPIRPPVSKPWPSGFEFYGMRDYSMGDDPRRIVWRATARTLDLDTGAGRYLVRESEQGITDRVSLLLDTDRSHHSPERPSDTFEAGVRAIASLGVKHLKDGFGVTLETNEGRIVEALRGQRNQIRFLDEMARLQPDRATLRDLMDRLLTSSRRDTHFVLATPHLDEQTATRLRLLLDRGISLMLVLLMWEDTDPASTHRAGALRCNVVEVDAESPLEGVFARAVGGGGRR